MIRSALSGTKIISSSRLSSEIIFSAEQQQIIHVAGSLTEDITDRDRVFDRLTTTTLRNRLSVQSFSPFTLESLDATGVVNDSMVEYVSNGLCRVNINFGQVKLRESITMAQVTGTTVDTVKSNVAGSFTRACIDYLAARIAGGFTSLSRFTGTTTTTSATPNSSFIASNVDWSGVPFLGARPVTLQSNYLGALIGPSTFLSAKHVAVHPGYTLYFRGSDGVIISRAVTAGVDLGDDVFISVLASPVPAEVAFYPVLPANYLDFTPTYKDDSITFITGQDVDDPGLWHTSNCPALGFRQSLSSTVLCWARPEQSLNFKQITNGDPGLASLSQFVPYSVAIIVGDSGSPSFLIPTATMPIIVGTWAGHYSSGEILNKYASINAWTAANGGDQLTYADLSAYTDYS